MGAMAGRREEIELERAEAAKHALKRSAEGEVVGAGSFVNSAAGHGSDDPAEIWGRRVGRGLGFVAVIVLILYLVTTYAGSR